MKVFVNEKEFLTSATNLVSLSNEMQLPDKGVAVAVDRKIIPRSEWNSFVLTDNMQITIIKAACGG